MFSSMAEMLPLEEPGFFLCLGWWSPGCGRGGVARPSGGTEPLPLERRGLWMVLGMVIIPHPQTFGDSRVCPCMLPTSLCSDVHRFSHLLCAVAGPKVPTVHLSDCAYQNLKFKKILIFLGLPVVFQPVGGAVAWSPSL